MKGLRHYLFAEKEVDPSRIRVAKAFGVVGWLFVPLAVWVAYEEPAGGFGGALLGLFAGYVLLSLWVWGSISLGSIRPWFNNWIFSAACLVSVLLCTGVVYRMRFERAQPTLEALLKRVRSGATLIDRTVQAGPFEIVRVERKGDVVALWMPGETGFVSAETNPKGLFNFADCTRIEGNWWYIALD